MVDDWWILTVEPAEAAEFRRWAATLPAPRLNTRQLSDLHLIATGAVSPLTGFMREADYRRVAADMRLESGLPWSLPVTLAVEADSVPAMGTDVVLADAGGAVRGCLRVEEAFGYDKEQEAAKVYGTTDAEHPGVAALYSQGEVLLAGNIRSLPHTSIWPQELSPAQTRDAIKARGWRTTVGFQTRNPVHRAHEYIQKCALEVVDGLLLHPLVGETKSDDIPAEVRMRCYEVLLANYYPPDRVLLNVLPAATRYASPREAIFHALVRKNYGCTHFIVGRDHAAWAPTKAPTRHKRSSLPSHQVSWASPHSTLGTAITVAVAGVWPLPRPARTTSASTFR